MILFYCGHGDLGKQSMEAGQGIFLPHRAKACAQTHLEENSCLPLDFHKKRLQKIWALSLRGFNCFKYFIILFFGIDLNESIKMNMERKLF